MKRPRRTLCRGLAAVELAFLLPFMVLLVMMVTDFARALQAQIVLVNITREGASLSARVPTYTQTQIVNSLAATAPPLKMTTDGMIYITTVMGQLEGNAVRNVVVAQTRLVNAGYAPASRLWNCGAGSSHWSGGSCTGIATGAGAPTAPLMTGQLANGETIYAVEAYYRFDMLFGLIDLAPGLKTPQITPDLHALTVM